MPPGGIAGIADFGSGLSVIMTSVVSTMRADRGGVLDRRARHLRRIDDAPSSMSAYSPVITSKPSVLLFAFGRLAADVLEHDRAVEAGVLRQLAQRLLERLAHDVDAGRGIALELELVERRLGVEQRHAAAGHDALLDRGARRRQRVLDAVLLLLELRPPCRRRP